MEEVRTILVPMDFSEAAAQAFHAALSLAEGRDSTVLVLHVLAPERLEAVAELGYAMPEEVTAKAKAHAKQRMRRLLEPAAPEGVELKPVVVPGSPVAEILKLSRELEADLIVLGVGAFFGSVADKVVRAASCPVLVIHAAVGDVEERVPPEGEPSGAPSAV